jgi:hypothetical protein
MDGSDSITGANRYARFGSLGSRSYGSDLPRARSNLTRSTAIGRLRGKGGPGAAIARRRPLPGDHSRGGGSPEMPSGPYFGRDQAREDARDTRNPPGQLAQVHGVATAHATARAARVDRARRRVRVPVPTVAYDPRQLALKVRGGVVVLTKVRNRLERGGVMPSTADRRWRRSGLVGGAAAEGLRAPDHRKPTRGGPVKACRGSARPMAYRR